MQGALPIRPESKLEAGCCGQAQLVALPRMRSGMKRYTTGGHPIVEAVSGVVKLGTGRGCDEVCT